MHVADGPQASGVLLTVDANTALGGLLQAGDEVEEGALAASAGADDAHELPFVDAHVHVAQDGERVSVDGEVLAYAVQLYLWMGGRFAWRVVRARGHFNRCWPESERSPADG